MITDIKNMTIQQKEEVFDPLFKEVHDKTIIGFVINLLKEQGGTVHESVVFNKTIQNFSQLRKASGGSYSGDPMSACRAALNSNNIFTKDAKNCWTLSEEQATKYYQNIKNRLMYCNPKKLMNLSLKYMNGLNQRLSVLSEQQSHEESKITLAISPKIMENYKQLDTKIKLYNKLNDYINKLPIESLRDLIRNPLFEHNENSECFNIPAELTGMLELYEFFKPILMKYHSTLQFFSQYSCLMKSLKVISERIQETIENAEGLYLGKARKVRRDLNSVALEFSDESEFDDGEEYKADYNSKNVIKNIKSSQPCVKDENQSFPQFNNTKSSKGYKENCEDSLLFKFSSIQQNDKEDGKWEDNDSFDDDNNDEEMYSQQQSDDFED